ncbi:hypothetical protein EG329_006285 [Mollisiaceae sp. DMI_Dod_QoI]|nr:hypothetical protein EG329_006285 [Helotiales sp. DMI_Dod_QoI]
MEDPQGMKVPDLRAELKRRDLPRKGRKQTLVTRLQHTYGLPITFEGRKAHNECELKEYQAAAVAKVTPFPYFSRLPLEIREYIWEYSLPGPRVLKSSIGPPCEHQLYFPKEGQPPNPATLFTCRESRTVALRRFKLCFGTANVFGDLPGGDVLYMINSYISWEWNETTSRSGQRHRSKTVHKKLCEDVVRDLEAVKHVVLPGSFWRRSKAPKWVVIGDGRSMRSSLKKLKSLERVSLIDDSRGDIDRVFAGHDKLSDPFFERPQIRLGLGDYSNDIEDFLEPDDERPHRETFSEWKERRKAILGDLDAVRFLGGFDLCDLEKCELERGIPEARIIKMNHVAYMPKRVMENDRGYPYQWCCGRVDDREGENTAGRSEEQDELSRMNARYSLRSR